MMALRKLTRRLARDTGGTMVVETAIVAPVLVLLSMGAYQISSLVARQSELQSAMGLAEAVVLSSSPTTEDKRTVLKNIIATSTGLAQDRITITEAFRCNASAAVVTASSQCTVGDKVSTYINITLVDTYEPFWRELGVGSDIALHVDRRILIQQATKL